MTPKIDGYLISWSGQHEKAVAIADELSGAVDRLTIIHSDDQAFQQAPQHRYIVVSNDWFYGRKFRTTASDFEGDVMLHVTADVRCADWKGLVERCRTAFDLLPQLGVWSPEIDYTPLSLDKTTVSAATLAQGDTVVEGLKFVTTTDSIVWALRRPVVNRLSDLDFDINNLGWGIDQVASAYCYANNGVAVVDSAVKVWHPFGSGYDRTEAAAQFHAFLEQLSFQEKIQLAIARRYDGVGPGKASIA